ncbi:SDR family oxidoreductase [Planctomycetota bacterium]|nr:SDR family oxidoreductase [Planctomycetota bacterium]
MDTLDTRIKSALVTGSAKRNGRALALWLAKRGVRVAVHFRASKAEAEAVAAECSTHTHGAIVVQGDLTDDSQAARVVEKCIETFDELHVLVNNIGNYLRKDLFDLSADEWREQVESNLYSSFFCMKPAVAHMKTLGFGRVVNLGYAGGERPTYNRLTVPYHIAKTGLATLTRSAASSLAKTGITVNTIGVGIMENSVIKPIDPPAGRFAGYEDLCHALGFLLSEGSDHINGTQIDVSGGWIPEQIL